MLSSLLLLSVAWTASGITDFFVSSTGSDSNTGTSRTFPFRTVARAQAAALTAAGNVNVNLDPGVYFLSGALNLSSWVGSQRTLTWQPYPASTGSVPPVTWSGGVPLSFKPSSNHPGLWVANTSHLLPQALQRGRQLYVNGRRAPRTSQPGSWKCSTSATSPCTRSLTVWGDKAWSIEKTNASKGFSIINGNAAKQAMAWPHSGTGVEFVFTGLGGSPWAESRCVVSSVAPTTSGVFVSMQEPCWSCWKYHTLVAKKQPHVPPPTAIENVGLPHIEPGEWWMDSDQGLLYYSPLRGEDIGAVVAVFPIVEQLVIGSGAGAGTGVPLSNIRFRNIRFQHATWFAPSMGRGFVEDQSGQSICPYLEDGRLLKTPASIAFSHATNIFFDLCEFSHLGANALAFDGGCHNNTVHRSNFHDISASALQIGGFDTAHVKELARQDVGNTLSHSVISHAAIEFHGAAAVSVGYTIATGIIHNDIGNCTYGPVSVGWGWGQLSYARNNVIIGNRVHDYKRLLNDGGCIYTLSPQPGSIIAENWCYGQGTPTAGALYPDEGSANMTWRDNVVSDMGAAEWAHVWKYTIRNIIFEGNFHDTPNIDNHGTNITIANDHLMKPGVFPATAKQIMQNSGPGASNWFEEAAASAFTPFSVSGAAMLV